MGETTAIGWTDHTFNPWWGCVKVSPACNNCYAEAFAKRTGNAVWGKSADRRFFGEKHWNEPLKWARKAEAEGVRRRVFCASMADVFEDRRDLDDARAQLWDLIGVCDSLDWLLLTKRPENVERLVPQWWDGCGWPSNIWLGTTVEDQKRAEERIPHLLAQPAKVRFLSCEPVLGRIDMRPYLIEGTGGIDWVIIGGESGPRHRPLNLDHARILRDQCLMLGIACFFKQVGGRTPAAGGDCLDGRTWKQFPGALIDGAEEGS